MSKRCLTVIGIALILIAESCSVYAAGNLGSSPDKLGIAKTLNNSEFKIYRRTSDVPVSYLKRSGLLEPGKELSDIMINPGPDPIAGHTMIDLKKPLYQLIFTGVSSDAFFIYFKARDPQGAAILLLIRSTPKKGVVSTAGYTSARARNLQELIRQLRKGDYEPLNLRDPLASPFGKIE